MGKIKESISKDIEIKLKNSMNILIESFVLYYGEKYRDIIEERIRNISFIFYCNYDKEREFRLDEGMTFSLNFEYIKDLYSKLIKETKKESKSFKKYRGLNKIIFSTVDLISFAEEELSDLNLFLQKDRAIQESAGKQHSKIIDNKYKSKIFIPFFFADDLMLIHEIVHAITRNLIGESYKNKKIITCHKLGIELINMDDKIDELIFEEIIADIEADNIFEIFNALGGKIMEEFYYKNKSISFYDKLKCLIYEFYNDFKKEIIYSRITLNKNYLLKIVGKVNFNYLNMWLNDILLNEYLQNEKKLNEIKKNYIDIIIKKMKENAILNDPEKENLEEYYLYLESLGYKVKRLERAL